MRLQSMDDTFSVEMSCIAICNSYIIGMGEKIENSAHRLKFLDQLRRKFRQIDEPVTDRGINEVAVCAIGLKPFR